LQDINCLAESKLVSFDCSKRLYTALNMTFLSTNNIDIRKLISYSLIF
jgi:hypothetical protein